MDEHIKLQFACHIPSYEEYAETIASMVKCAYPDEEPELIMEPGAGLVSNVLHFYTRILHLKKIRDRNYAVCSGSVFNVKPSLHKKHLSIECIPYPDHEHMAVAQDYENEKYFRSSKTILLGGFRFAPPILRRPQTMLASL